MMRKAKEEWVVIKPRQGAPSKIIPFIKVRKSTVYLSPATVQLLKIEEPGRRVILAINDEELALGSGEVGITVRINENTGSANIYSAPILRAGLSLGRYEIESEPVEIDGVQFFKIKPEQDG